jgi:serine/threonine protein kinase
MAGPLGVGSRIANYRVEALIGEGGMGSVFRARDERLGRQVAIKVLRPTLAVDRDFRLRFIRESKAAAAVDHPNIIPVFEADEYEGLLFIAMRYVAGGDVQSLLNRAGWLPPRQALSIVAAMASALDAAHAAGLVHRDVKPANMLLDSSTNPDAHVYLTDFGITTLKTDAADPSSPDGVAGTLYYMAPEAVEGRSVDGRADQFGLACAAFAMLSGSLPFEGRTYPEYVAALLNGDPAALTARRPELPAEVDRVFEQALARSPAARFATCRQFAAALGKALASVVPEHLDDGPAVARRLDVPLKETFRYVHEPSPGGDVFASLGNDTLVSDLESRIRHSRGGTFLVTGFRGVGKTTLVMRALERLGAGSPPESRTLSVSLSVARSTTTEQLLFAIVRRVFETLSDSGELERLPSETRHALLVAYMRTSLSFKETQSDSRQRSAGLNVGVGSGHLVKAVADIAVPSVSMSASRSQSLATEAAFLAYSETDVEYDLMRIVSLVDKAYGHSPKVRSKLRRLIPRARRSAEVPRRLHVIIVLDEVDKLTVDDAGLATVEALISGIKNILTMPGVHFLVVAGPDLHDRAVRDVARGNGVYESVFGWRLYVPCVWDAPDRLIADIVRERDYAADGVESFVQYLRFKARGVPRRLLQEVNDFVIWEEEHPWLRVDAKEMERVEFYARLERVLRNFVEGGTNSRLFPVAIDDDRWRLGGYFVVDWVLQSEGDPFTASELVREGEDAKFDPLLRISRRSIDRLLDHLARNEILEVVRGVSAANTFISDVTESNEKVYRLAQRISDQLSGFAERRESERADLGASLSVPPGASLFHSNPTWDPAWRAAVPAALPSTHAFVIGKHYAVGELLSQGGLSSVYKGTDLRTGRQVVIKMLRAPLADEPVALGRFSREYEILKKLSHSNVVHVYDFVDGPVEYAIVMERLQGPTLEEQVRRDGPMSPGEVAAMGQILAGAIDYLATQQVVRLDLKPSNIVMADRGPVIIDLGIAFSMASATRLTDAGQVIGTPEFMSPEAVQSLPVGPQNDIYGLGLVMYYALVGRTPWGKGDLFAILGRILTERIDLSDLHVSPSLRDIIARATAKDPADRFPSAGAIQAALLETPEWHSVNVGIGDTIRDRHHTTHYVPPTRSDRAALPAANGEAAPPTAFPAARPAGNGESGRGAAPPTVFPVTPPAANAESAGETVPPTMFLGPVSPPDEANRAPRVPEQPPPTMSGA